MSTIEIPLSKLTKDSATKSDEAESLTVVDGETGINVSAQSGVQSGIQSGIQRVNPADTKKVGVATLGCKVNLYESELISQSLRTQDWTLVSATDEADLYLVNTCTVTREADRQARQQVRRMVRQNPEALVIVTGCYAQMDADACAAIPGVDLVVGNDRKLDIHSLLPQLQRGELPKVMVGDLDAQISLPDQLVTGFEAHTRAFVQIQQGCDQGCTFCIIHRARGPSRSLSQSLIKRQVQRLVLNGYPEIVICGVDLGSYGEDLADQSASLVTLLQALLTLDYDQDNPFRIRLSSIDPHHITDDLIALMASEPRICSHIHLSLQSGSTLILKRMKRRYTADHVVDRLTKLYAVLPELVISADVMVGFPTETEQNFQETATILEQLTIAFPHIFSYSERDGTPAARIPANRQVPVPERKQRNKRLHQLAATLQEPLLQAQIGKTAWVLPERHNTDKQHFICRAENYLAVIINENQESDAINVGKWIKVQYQCLEQGFLIALPV